MQTGPHNDPETESRSPFIPPGNKRFYRQYGDDFGICVNIGKKGYTYIEDTMYKTYAFFYGLSGECRMGKLFDPNPRTLKLRTFCDYQEFWEDEPGTHPGFVVELLEDTLTIGFNVFDNSSIWEAKLLLPEDETKIISMPYEKNILVCMTGKLTIDGNRYKRYDYLRLEKNKEYMVDEWNNAEVGIFSVVGKR